MRNGVCQNRTLTNWTLTMHFNIKSYFTQGNSRSLAIKKNILGSFALKCISIIVSLQVVPLTINYINPSQYGIWLALSSIIAWLGYFDLGFAHGFRNRFAEARAKNDLQSAKDYVSTTYAVLTLLFTIVLFIALIINRFFNWCSILNISDCSNDELQVVFGLLACFFCINIVGSVFTTMLTADQKPALASLIQTSGQVLAFICIYVLTKTVPGNLTVLAFAFSGIPCIFLIIVSVIVFQFKKYKVVAPSIKNVHFNLTNNILGLGAQFFVIMISSIFTFQFINIIISRLEGPVAVTQYNLTYKYYSVLNMVVTIIITPFWSAFTDAYVKKDYIWMKRMVDKLERMWLLCIPALVIMILFSNFFFNFWLGDSVYIPFSLSICVSLYVLFQTGGGVYMTLINGTSKVRLQMIIYVFFAFISIPLIYYFVKTYGLEGALIVPSFLYLIQMAIGKIQISKLVNGSARGIFNK